MAELTKKDVTGMVAILRANYSWSFKQDKDSAKVFINTWYAILQKYPRELVQEAFYKSLETCKMPPTIADLVEIMKDMIAATQKSDQELWGELQRAFSIAYSESDKYSYGVIDKETGLTQGQLARKRVQEAYDNLDKQLKEYVGDRDQFMRMALHNDQWEFEKGRFMKAIGDIRERVYLKKTMTEQTKRVARETFEGIFEIIKQENETLMIEGGIENE